MPPKQLGVFAQTWYRWKALRLPWRKRFLVGYDLDGNTFWEFRLSHDDVRWRRIVKYPRSAHYSSVKVSPLWHQWLRHTREDPPSMEEQYGDVARQVKMKYLAAQADARWEAKPRVMDAPAEEQSRQQPSPALQTPVVGGESAGGGPTQSSGSRSQAGNEAKDDPWANARAHGPGEKWQPEAWTPGSAKR